MLELNGAGLMVLVRSGSFRPALSFGQGNRTVGDR